MRDEKDNTDLFFGAHDSVRSRTRAGSVRRPDSTEYGDKLSAGNKEAIQKALSDLKDAHKEKDLAKIETTMATLNTAWQAASEEMYKATQNAGGTQGGPADANTQQPNQDGGQKAEGDVTDVDFEEVKEDKK